MRYKLWTCWWLAAVAALAAPGCTDWTWPGVTQPIGPKAQVVAARDSLTATGNALAALIESKQITGDNAKAVQLLLHQAAKTLDAWEVAVLIGQSGSAEKADFQAMLTELVNRRVNPAGKEGAK